MSRPCEFSGIVEVRAVLQQWNKEGEVITPWDERAEANPTFAFALICWRLRDHAFRSKA
jgi:hypothetical protein